MSGNYFDNLGLEIREALKPAPASHAQIKERVLSSLCTERRAQGGRGTFLSSHALSAKCKNNPGQQLIHKHPPEMFTFLSMQNYLSRAPLG